jgi:hypothetical protein
MPKCILQPAWLLPLTSVDVTANLPGYTILSGVSFRKVHVGGDLFAGLRWNKFIAIK